jgi:hypothetical protein
MAVPGTIKQRTIPLLDIFPKGLKAGLEEMLECQSSQEHYSQQLKN